MDQTLVTAPHTRRAKVNVRHTSMCDFHTSVAPVEFCPTLILTRYSSQVQDPSSGVTTGSVQRAWMHVCVRDITIYTSETSVKSLCTQFQHLELRV